MNFSTYQDIKQKVIDAGYQSEIDWCQQVKSCPRHVEFFLEFTWVVVNSGIKNQIAEKIYERIIDAIRDGRQQHMKYSAIKGR